MSNGVEVIMTKEVLQRLVNEEVKIEKKKQGKAAKLKKRKKNKFRHTTCISAQVLKAKRKILSKTDDSSS